MRTLPDTAAALTEIGAGVLAMSGARPMRARVAAQWEGAHVSAPALPVRCGSGDSLALHVAVVRAEPGSVIVASVGELREVAYWDEVLTAAAVARDLSGVVIDGGIRGVDAMRENRFAAFATCRALHSARRARPGTVGVEIKCGGVSVRPGDWIVADADGVVVVPAPRLIDVVEFGRRRAGELANLRDAVDRGRTTIDLLSLDTDPVEVSLA